VQPQEKSKTSEAKPTAEPIAHKEVTPTPAPPKDKMTDATGAVKSTESPKEVTPTPAPPKDKMTDATMGAAKSTESPSTPAAATKAVTPSVASPVPTPAMPTK
jgi:hypothetical protein